MAMFPHKNPGPPNPFDYIRTAQEYSAQETPQQKLLALHAELTRHAVEIMRKKNHDYASSADPFRNFRTFGLLGVLVRLSDKLSRLHSFEEQGVTKVSDESITDTIIDIINYAVIFEAMRREAK